MSLLVETTVKVSLILVFALALMPLVGRRSAALRHVVLSVAITCAAVVPFAGLVTPSWHLPVRVVSVLPDAIVPIGARPEASVVLARELWIREAAPAETDALSLVGAALMTIWVGGAAFGVVVLLYGLARLGRMTSRAERIADATWVDHAEVLRREFGFRRPVVLLQSSHPTLLVTWGLIRPKVSLPAVAQTWRADRVSLVLSHELAHVRRGDWIVQLTAELLRALYWFNPLCWMACTRLRQESEQACDDVVLNRGVEGSEYATHLVEIARDLQEHRTWLPVLAMAHTSGFERRVRAMLNVRLNRRPVSRSVCSAIFVAWLGVTIPIAGLAAAQTAFARFAGSVADPQNGLLPGVTLMLTNVQTNARHEVRSDHTGRYEFTGLAPGEYLLETRLPGFSVLYGKLTLAGQNVEQDLTLQVGTLQETVTVRASASQGETSSPLDPRVQEEIERKKILRAAAKCPGVPNRSGPAIGGNLRAPMKIADAKPVYPDALRIAGVGGTVVLSGRIGTEGRLDELNVVSASHADLASAAVEAVQQWQFDSTLLNCVAVEVGITVTVHFEQ